MLTASSQRLAAPPAISTPVTLTLTMLAILSLGQGTAFARTQDANIIPLVALGAISGTNYPISSRGDLLLASDGNIYFTGSTGGETNVGAVARMTPGGVATTIHSFKGGNTEGQSPFAGVIQASDGNLYGTTYVGGDGSGGTVYRLTLGGTYTLLHSFKSGKADPHFLYAGLVQASDGDLYGTTLRGGANDKGSVFRITLDGTLTQLHDFNGDDGENPEGTLVQGSDGNLYGTTLQGGSHNRGTLFRVTTGGAMTSLYSFPSLSDFSTAGVATNATGANPRAGLLLAADGNFYGTAYQGGPIGYGTVFRATTAGAVTLVHAFEGPNATGGSFPLSSISQDAAGNMYGTTERGGALNQGSAWRISSAGQFSVLHSFVGTGLDGAQPYATLLPLGGYLYGVTYTDVTYRSGALLKLDVGDGVNLPIEFSVAPANIPIGSTATLTWSSPTATGCTTTGAWSNTVNTQGTLVVTPAQAAIYNYALSCTDTGGVNRFAYVSLQVNAPPEEPVDGGGGGGGGTMPVSLLLLLSGMLLRKRFV
jgi:uncharacterized repeat protein (TIGR03803 family)